MAATDTRIPVSLDSRRDLRIVKAHEDVNTYDEAIQVLVDGYDEPSSTQ